VKDAVDRWTERADDGRHGSADEELAGRILRDARARSPLSPEAMNRIEARLLEGGRHASMPGPSRWRVAALAGLLLGVGGVAGAGITMVATLERTSSESIIERKAVSSAPRSGKLAPVSPPVVSPVPTPELEALRPETETKVPHRAPPPPPRPEVREQVAANVAGGNLAPARLAVAPPPPTLEPSAAPAPEPRSGVSLEARLLGDAVRALRVDGDPKRALALLEEHRTRFAEGLLSAEVTLARVEALGALDRTREALALLDATDLDRLPRARELRVLRGELRAGAVRCPLAILDFDRVLSGETDSGLAERALYGRAVCRSSLRDVAGARADLEAYLARFPAGPHAPEIRRALGQ
jgi:hypothetical protein